jgi:adenylate cyclase class IV
MARNLEIKVGCTSNDMQEIRERAARMGCGPLTILRQTDTYFVVSQGRLKLREITQETGERTAELIAYRRADRSDSRWSDYRRVEIPVGQVGSLSTALELTCGLSTVVVKLRQVMIWNRTRVHLDEVDNVGAFVELETVAGADDLDEDIQSEHALAIRLLGLDKLPVIAGSYSDMIPKHPQRT